MELKLKDGTELKVGDYVRMANGSIGLETVRITWHDDKWIIYNGDYYEEIPRFINRVFYKLEYTPRNKPIRWFFNTLLGK